MRFAIAACLTSSLVLRSLPALAEELRFESDVRPILKAMCFQCHGEEDDVRGQFDVRLVRSMLTGGESGPAIVPGHPDQSLLWQRVESDEMPEGTKKLTLTQKAILKQWIAQGALTQRPEPARAEDARFTAQELSFWSFQPVQPTAIPDNASATPIDAFLRAKLLSHGLDYSAEADRRTLIRRLTFDLIGLPPTPEEIQAFVNDTSPQAYESVIDRLLASPHYGERWARHWLDVAGYAETDGPLALDKPRPHAWRYRDYVIRSLNSDKPIDRFLQEQLAGDELAPHPLNPSDPATIELLTATGFLRMPPDSTQIMNTVLDRNAAAADVVKVVGSSLLGLTIGCAQCHDHRYDPLPTEDYYRLRAVFDPAFHLQEWKTPEQRLTDVTSAEGVANRARIEAEAVEQERIIGEEELAHAATLLEKEFEKIPEEQRELFRKILATPEAERSEEHKELLKKQPRLHPATTIKALLEVYDGVAFQKFKAKKDAVAKLRATKAFVMVMTVNEPHNFVPESRVMFRGNPDQLRTPVPPSEPFILAQHRPTREIPANNAGVPTTGRRLALAQRLTDGQHPLTARVFVNRVWLHHFGKGLVNTPGDFGLNGERPSHPELLDWLTDDFVKHGWSLKRLHKQLLTTQAWRQQSTHRPDLDAVDAENRWLGRSNLRRLDAESVRDALLCVSGTLKPAVFGASVPVTEDYVGRGVIGKRELSVFGKPYGPFESVGDEINRRSIYVEVNRAIPLSMMDTFDLPSLSPNCEMRHYSTVPPQSLMFLNDAGVVTHSEQLACNRLWSLRDNLHDRIRLASEILFATPFADDELAACAEYVTQQAEYWRHSGDSAWREAVANDAQLPDKRALSTLCQTMLASNRFLYVD